MKTLINLLNETDVGKYLFADPSQSVNSKIDNKISKYFNEFNSIPEPNTDDENRLLQVIYDYFSNNNHDTEVYDAFYELLQLKNKYPKILDPLYATHNENKMQHNRAYRCVTMQINIFNKLVGTDDFNAFYDKCIKEASDNDMFIDIRNTTTNQIKEGNLFLSFASNLIGAEQMALYRIAQKPSYEQPVVVFACDYSQLKNKSVINPDFAEILNPYGNENEFIYLDTTYKFTSMHFYL